jgi:wyosine [tRNA(Phe)-imidazoG37] synthetase (radical SAM superfamily)
VGEFKLNVTEHNRDVVGLRYVYPVISRRSRGVSVGINLNTNNACNWRCIYCQVPDLKLGTAPPVDLALLEKELRSFFDEILHGDFMLTHVPEEARRINDIALSGNGEPTSSAEFVQVIELIGKIRRELSLPSQIKLVLITNGSLIQRENVQQGLRLMTALHGEVWFKLDRATEQGLLIVNDTKTTLDKVRENLMTAISCCPNTWLQTCWFSLDGSAPSQNEEDAYLQFLNDLHQRGAMLKGVLLYGIARASMQPEASRIQPLSKEIMECFANRIRNQGVLVNIAE